MSVWGDKIRPNFERLMGTDITTDAHSLFTETKATNSLIHQSTGTYNGSYSIQMAGLEVDYEINNTWLFTYTVTLKLGFTINPKQRYDSTTATVVNDKLEYNEAIEDVELIVSKALNPTYYGSLVEVMELSGASALEYSDEIETFATCELTFKCGGRATI
jgi:hypothetical protein